MVAAGIACLAMPARAVVFPDGYLVDTRGQMVPAKLILTTYEGGRESITGYCSGTFISQSVVLTAAHCLSAEPGDSVRIEYSVLKGSKMVTKQALPRHWYIHQRYSERTNIHDVGLIVLKSKAKGVVTVKLPPRNDTSLENFRQLTLLGWGLDQNNKTHSSPGVALVKSMTGKASGIFEGFNKNYMIAAGKYREGEDLYSGACSGDSGGPLLAIFGNSVFVIGITSYTAESCDSRYPSVFTRVSAEVEWIRTAAKGYL